MLRFEVASASIQKRSRTLRSASPSGARRLTDMDASVVKDARLFSRIRAWRPPIAAAAASFYALALVAPISEVCAASYPGICAPESRESVALQSALILLIVLMVGLLALALVGHARRIPASRWVTGGVVAAGLVLIGRTLLFTGFALSPIRRIDASVAVPVALTAAAALTAAVGWILDNHIQSAPPAASRAVLRVGLVLLAASGAWLLIWSVFFIQPS